MAWYPACNLFLSPPSPAFIISFSPRVLVCVHLWKETVFYRVIFRCLPCGHMKVTVPGCVCVHIDARKTCVRASRTGQVDRTWLTRPQQGTRVPKQAHILNCLHSCQSGLAGAELVVPDPNRAQTQQRASPPHPSLPRLKIKVFGRPKDGPQMCRLLQLQWQISDPNPVTGRVRRSGRLRRTAFFSFLILLRQSPWFSKRDVLPPTGF